MEKFSSSGKLIFVNINKSFEAMKSNDTASPHYRKSLKECTVKYWAVKDEKAFAATHILGCYQGKVIEVVKITNVKLANLNEYPGRKVFEGSGSTWRLFMLRRSNARRTISRSSNA